MDSPQKMDVANWQDSPPPTVSKTRTRPGFFPPSVMGILGTVLLHALFIQSVSFGSRGPEAKLPEAQESANALSKPIHGADSLVLISLPTNAGTNRATSASTMSSLPDLSKTKIKPDVHVDSPELLSMETLALSEDQSTKSTIEGADGVDHARLFGIYAGQIQARIARVWRRPRTPVSENKPSVDADESFQCEAQIVQDVRGNVQEILLPRCNGSAAWQRSLVLAIQQASPLPAPPSIKVFTQSITLNFVGLPYVQGASNEEYEIVPLARVD